MKAKEDAEQRDEVRGQRQTVLPGRKRIGRKGADKRQMLIDVGTEIFTQQGFSMTGLDALTDAAGVPKGSFYYYFSSKDEFVGEVIKNYGLYFSRKLSRILEDENTPPLERLRIFTGEATAGVTKFNFKRGCLVGNLGQEMGTLQESFRILLLDVLGNWREQVQRCLSAAQNAGEIRTDIDASDLARFFWSAWEGAVLCAKLERSTAPLTNVARLFLNDFLRRD